MATATWFDYNAYMANKLVQVNAIDPKVQYTPETLKAEFEKAGYVGEEGAFKHFEQYGKTEDVAPNALFDADEYITAKAADFFKTDKPTASNIAEVAKAFADGGMSAWDHYVAYGSSEGVEPSFSFNTDAYLTAKAAALNTGKYDGKENWTAEDVAAAIKASGSTVLEHFMANGGGGEAEVAVTYKGIADGGVKNPFIDPTPPTAVPDPNPGETFTLGTGVDAVVGTDKDDIINGATSGSPAGQTLNPKDTIDGGLGTDTLNVKMTGDFAGFTADTGFMKNVEVVNLTGDSTNVRTFNAKGVSDVINYNIDATKGKVNLSNLADTKAVISLKGQQSGEFKVAYDKTAVEGTDDAASFVVEGVGKTGTTGYVTVNAAGIENMSLKSTGANFVNFAADSGMESLILTGTGDLTVNQVSKALTTIDAGAASGNLDINVAQATDGNIATVRLGSGDDILRATVDDLATSAEIDGGLGEDTLHLTSTKEDTLALNMTDVETVSVGSLASALTFSTKNVTGLTTLEITKSANQDVLVSGLGDVDFNVNLTGANAGGKAATVDNTGIANVHVSSAEKGHTAEARGANAYGVTLSKSGSLNVTVDANMTYTGAITASAATNLKVESAGVYGGTITAGKATEAELTFTGKAASAATLAADKLQSLSINSNKDFALATAVDSTFGELTTLNVETGGAFTFGGALAKINTMNLSGNGAVDLTGADLGSDDLEEDVTIMATGLAKGLTLGDISTKGTNIKIDAKEVDGALTIGDIDSNDGTVDVALGSNVAALASVNGISGKVVNVDASATLKGTLTIGDLNVIESLTYVGSDTVSNVVTGNAVAKATAPTDTDVVSMSFTGGAKVDAFTVAAGTGFEGMIDITADGGGGTDTLTLDGSTADLIVKSLNLTDIEGIATSGNVDFSALTEGVTVTSASTGLIIGGSGDDKVTATQDNFRFDGGEGEDTITLLATGTTADTIVLRSTNAADADTIINFATGSDKIELGSEFVQFSKGGGAATIADVVSVTASADAIASGNAGNVVVLVGAVATDALTAQFTSGDGMKNKEFIVTAGVGANGDAHIWYVKDGGNGIIETNEIHLMGTLKGGGIADISSIFQIEAVAP